MKVARYLPIVISLIFSYGVSASLAQQQIGPKFTSLSLDSESEIRFAPPWRAGTMKYTNAQELVVTSDTQLPLARALITVEPRSSYADALDRLEAIAASRTEPKEFIQIGGWPAVEIRFREQLPRRGAAGAKGEETEAEGSLANVNVQRLITAIAAGEKVVRFDVTLLPDAPRGLLQGAQELARSTHFTEQGDSAEVQQALQKMRAAESKRRSRQPRQGAAPRTGSVVEPAATARQSGVPTAVQAGKGELEIATSADASNVIIASNNGLSFSTDQAATFAAGAPGIFGLNDPSLARAVSGNFYLGVIAFPNGTPPQLNVTGCTNAVSQSTTNGATFVLRGYSAQCPFAGPGVCFPDQEHIAADAINAAAGANDQLYAVWRNFTPAGPAANCGSIGGGFVSASISCSQNSGVAWTAVLRSSAVATFLVWQSAQPVTSML
jgi:hypothetical protein